MINEQQRNFYQALQYNSSARSFLREWNPVDFLGSGSFGSVYLIRRGEESCAVKVMRLSGEMTERYKSEIEALDKIRGERHAVNVYEYENISFDKGGFSENYLAIRMERLNKLPQTMPEDEVITMGIQLSFFLEKCHNNSPKLFHRDIKPDNILVSDEGIYKLSDFGEAKLTDMTQNSSGYRGTPLYMSPEMHNFDGYDGRSDLYSLGVTMYTLLNDGIAPFAENGDLREAIHKRFAGEKLPDITGVSTDMMEILRKLCAVDRDDRYDSAQELGEALYGLELKHKKFGTGQTRHSGEQTAHPSGAGGYPDDSLRNYPEIAGVFTIEKSGRKPNGYDYEIVSSCAAFKNQFDLLEPASRQSFGNSYKAVDKFLGTKCEVYLYPVPYEKKEAEDMLRSGRASRKTLEKYYNDKLDELVGHAKIIPLLSDCFNIVKVYGTGIARADTKPGDPAPLGGCYWMSTELLDRLENTTAAGEYQRVSMAIDICGALDYIHSRGIIHRDVKPGNIFYYNNVGFKLGGFEVALAAPGSRDKTVSGTPNFMAPEILLAYLNGATLTAFDETVDIYSLGATVYTVLNGWKPAFVPYDTKVITNEIMRKALQTRLRGDPLPGIPGVSEELLKILRKACSLKPQDRYRGAKEMKNALIDYLDSKRR